MVTDAKGGSVVMGTDATAQPVNIAGANGWLVRSRKASLPALVWVGTTGGQWSVRDLSINDCRAEVRVGADGLTIDYGNGSTVLPHGGGVLLDVALTPPEGAVRLELLPQGLGFGAKAEGVNFCRTGWWGSRVTVRRLPPGEYQLRWYTADETLSEATLVLEGERARGASVVRVSKP